MYIIFYAFMVLNRIGVIFAIFLYAIGSCDKILLTTIFTCITISGMVGRAAFGGLLRNASPGYILVGRAALGGPLELLSTQL